MKIVLFAAITILFVGSALLSASGTCAARGGDISTREFLNPDGTVNLTTGREGSINLQGWNVQLDPARGPILAPQSPTAANWSALDFGVEGNVNTLLVSSGDVYVGGEFVLVCGNLACSSGNVTVNRIAKWNGSSWSGIGNGVNNPVNTLMKKGSDLYVGGAFTQVCGNAACEDNHNM